MTMRRRIRQATGPTTAGLAAPAILARPGFGRSPGAVEVVSRDGPLRPDMTGRGVAVDLSTHGSEDEAARGRGFDVAPPSVADVAGRRKGDAPLLQPIDGSKVRTGDGLPSLGRDPIPLGAVQPGERVAIPRDRGTEAMTLGAAVLEGGPGAEVSRGKLRTRRAEGRTAAARRLSATVGTAETPSNLRRWRADAPDSAPALRESADRIADAA